MIPRCSLRPVRITKQGEVYKDIAAAQTPSAAYKTRDVEVVRKWVAFGGYRLAALLNAIWPNSH